MTFEHPISISLSDDSSDKEAYTEQLQAAETLRSKLHIWTESAVSREPGVDREWANTWLARLGVTPVIGKSEYRLNTPVTGYFGYTIVATSRAEAQKIFKQLVDKVAQAGKISSDVVYCPAVYDVEFPNPDEVTFFAGPADPAMGPSPEQVPDAELPVQIRQMLIEGVMEQNWGYTYARNALKDMGLPKLPDIGYRTVDVPVSGTAQVQIRVFEDSDDAAVQRIVAAQLRNSGQVAIKPEEMGEASVRSEQGSEEDVVF